MSLSRRDHFALAAMQGLLAEDSQFQLTDDKLAKWAVTQADALIAELDRTAPKPEPKPANELPDWVPPLPEGTVLLGWGDSFKTNWPFKGWSSNVKEPNWHLENAWEGADATRLYAAPAGSEIAKINGKGAA